MKVFVEWDDRTLSAASWILLRSLNKDAANGGIYSTVRYPHFAEQMFPKLPISGSPEDHLSDLDHETISESPAYLSASSIEEINETLFRILK